MAEAHDIFLSYASKDLERVRPLIRALEGRGWRVWWDRTMLPGDDYEEVIDQAIAATGCVIVVWSHASVDSNWVRAEADEGRRLRKLVPVMIDEVRIPLSFRATHTAPLMDWQEGAPHQEFERVVQAVTNLVPPSPPPELEEIPPPPPPPDAAERPEPRVIGEEPTHGSKAGLIWGVSLGVVVLALVVWLVVGKRPEPGTYALTIRATPADSVITFMNSAMTYTPGVALPSGRYDIDVSRAGYVTTRRTVTIGEADVFLEIALVPAPKQYALTVRAQPSDSTVRLLHTDVRYRPGVKLAPGRYTVEIAKDGYETVRREVVITAADVALDVTLSPVKTIYKLTVRAFPEDSTIKILNIVPKYHPGIELEPGEYHLWVGREGFRTKRRTVTIRDADVVEEIVLEPEMYQFRGTVPALFRNSLGMEFVLIPDGEFEMGSSADEVDQVVKQYGIERRWVEDETPKRTVRISRPFYIGKFEVTQRQWQEVMGKNPSYFTGNLDLPVEQVSWEDAQEFVAKLNEREPGELYRLPTEAEWEYAARAGSTTAYSFGDDPAQLEKYAWYDKNADGKTHPVGALQPNTWGVHDMHGNVWEWVQDWKGEYSAAAVTDPAGPAAGSLRVIRGGRWGFTAGNCRSANRIGWHPGYHSYYLGLRLVREVR